MTTKKTYRAGDVLPDGSVIRDITPNAKRNFRHAIIMVPEYYTCIIAPDGDAILHEYHGDNLEQAVRAFRERVKANI